MFNFFSMADNYEDRKIDNTIINETEIDTVAVYDSEQPFETGIKSSLYNDNQWIIVEMYDTKEEAIIGHKKWCLMFESKKFPPHLEDVSTAEIKILADAFSNKSYNIKKISIK